MDCTQARELVTRLVSGESSPAEQGELETHLASCAACDGLHSKFSRVWDVMGRLRHVSLPEHKSRATADHVRQSASWRRVRTLSIAAAAAVLVLAASVLLLLPRTPAPTDTVAPVAAEEKSEPADSARKEEAVRAEALLVSIGEERRDPTPAPSPAPVPPVQDPAPAPVVPAPRAPEPPAPAPAVPTPAPQPVAPAPVRETLAHVATLDRVQGEAFVLHESKRIPAKAGQRILATQGLETEGNGSQAVVEYQDGTRLVLGSESVISTFGTRPAAGKTPGGRVLSLSRGVLAAQVARQPAGEQMAFTTPHGEARVLGTRLTLSVSSTATLVEVTEGKVRLVRSADGASVDVSAGHYAVAGAKGPALAARTSAPKRIALAETFDRGRWGQAWVQQAESGSSPRFAVQTGALTLKFPRQSPVEVTPSGIGPTDGGKGPADLGQKAIDSVMQGVASRGEWPRSTWLETRQSFPLSADAPLRIHARLWQSHADLERSSWIAINRKGASQIVLERRGDLLQLWGGGQPAVLFKAERPCTQEAEVVELWITPDRIILRQNDVTLHSGANPSRSKTVQLSLGGGAKLHLGQDEEVRFDDVEVAWMTPADLAKILK